jgi:hypothetical protein
VYRTSACSRSKSRELKSQSIVAWMLSPFTKKRQWSGESNQPGKGAEGIKVVGRQWKEFTISSTFVNYGTSRKGLSKAKLQLGTMLSRAREESDKNLTAQQRWPSCVGEGRRSRRQILAKLPRKYEGFSNVRFGKTLIDTARVIP